MCSTSWLINNEELFLVFNRDESRLRGIAKPPVKRTVDNCRIIMPEDPDGNGSWISVNEHGLVLGLLNLYEFDLMSEISFDSKRQKEFTSRGKLIKDLAMSRDSQAIESALNSIELRHYQPFRLIAVSRESQIQLLWDSNQLSVKILPAFVTSSSLKSKQVIDYRTELFQNSTLNNTESLINFHSKHSERGMDFSVCMHRESSQTVSMSTIKVTESEVEFRYWNGPPCTVKNSTQMKISRR